ncbi:MAG: hypothetical protein GX616_23105 [Planctomycetes bacterium]|nr:hypothetical protein [Planctomycetota bacterium]
MIVFGDTLVLAGIAASIGKDPGCEVVARARPVGRQELCALQPDVVIFDLDAVQPDFQYSLAQELPGLLLIGMDPKTNRAVLWCGQQAEDLSSQDLTQIIHQTKSQGNP